MNHPVPKPSFGGRLRNPEYYTDLAGIIETLRPTASLRTIANHLNSLNFTTPSGKEFNRYRLSNFIHSKKTLN